MAQLLLDVEIDRRKELSCSDRLKIVFGETKEVLLPLMRQYISENIFTVEQRSSYSETIKKHMLYLLDNKQYFERATFVGLGIVSLGTAWEPYANVLIGEEFIYISQMILDDIVDMQISRMGRPTINHLIGKEKAIAIAEIFEAEGYKLIQNGISDLSKDKQIIIMNKMFEMMTNIYYAQYIDIENTKANIDDIDLNNYMHFLRFTTPSDIANCFYMGTTVGGASSDVAKKFYDFGCNLGMLMQIKDDYIDFLDADVAHKDTLLDIMNGNKRMPFILAYNFLTDPQDRDFILSVLGNKKIDHVDRIKLKKIIFSDEIMIYSQAIVNKIMNQTKDMLTTLQIEKEGIKGVLEDILDSLQIWK